MMPALVAYPLVLVGGPGIAIVLVTLNTGRRARKGGVVKVSTDEVGINVTWNRGTTLRVVKQFARKRTLAAAIVAIFLYIVFGHWLLDAIFGVILVAMLATLTYVAIKAREPGKPSLLDYSLIARMEREVWGETFEHAGAPRPAISPVTSIADLLGPLPPGVSPHRAACLRCGAPQARVLFDGHCPACYRERQRGGR